MSKFLSFESIETLGRLYKGKPTFIALLIIIRHSDLNESSEYVFCKKSVLNDLSQSFDFIEEATQEDTTKSFLRRSKSFEGDIFKDYLRGERVPINAIIALAFNKKSSDEHRIITSHLKKIVGPDIWSLWFSDPINIIYDCDSPTLTSEWNLTKAKGDLSVKFDNGSLETVKSKAREYDRGPYTQPLLKKTSSFILLNNTLENIYPNFNQRIHPKQNKRNRK